jgi:carbamoyl-phosphate synthase small subunit
MSNSKKAVLLLEDGTFFEGRSCGAEGIRFGEICFNTAAIGYPEVISDPGYGGQIVVMTYPQIGNYGINYADLQSDELALSALVARDICKTPSNFRSEVSLPELLVQKGIVAIEDIDTRLLVTHIRDNGSMKAVVSTEELGKDELLAKLNESLPLGAQDPVQNISTKTSYEFDFDDSVFGELLEPGFVGSKHVAVYDCGCKRSILRGLVRAGFKVTVVPHDTSADEVVALGVDAVLLSNGPGSPERAVATIEAARLLADKLPVFGIGLGHQLLALAAGGSVKKLKVGHHGGNYPAVDPLDGTVEITSQAHNYTVLFESLGELIPDLSGGQTDHPKDLRFWVEQGVAPVVDNALFGRIQLTKINLNDGTVEGLSYLDQNTFSTQYHPAINPGLIKADTAFDLMRQVVSGEHVLSDVGNTTSDPGKVKGN